MSKKCGSGRLRIVWRWIVDIVVIIIGSGIYALGVHSFTSPNDIAP